MNQHTAATVSTVHCVSLTLLPSLCCPRSAAHHTAARAAAGGAGLPPHALSPASLLVTPLTDAAVWASFAAAAAEPFAAARVCAISLEGGGGATLSPDASSGASASRVSSSTCAAACCGSFTQVLFVERFGPPAVSRGSGLGSCCRVQGERMKDAWKRWTGCNPAHVHSKLHSSQVMLGEGEGRG